MDNEALENAKRQIAFVTDQKIKNLLKVKELGDELNFSSGQDTFEKIIALFQEVQNCDLTKLTTEDLNRISARADNVLRVFQKIRSWSPSKLLLEWGPDPVLQRGRLIDEANSVYRQVYEDFKILIPYAKPESTVKDLEDRAKIVKNLEDEVKTALKRIEDSEKEAQSAIQTIREVAADTGVTIHAENFKNEARSHLWAARFWLIALCLDLLTIVTITLSDWFAPGISELISKGLYKEASPLILNKLVVLGALYFLIVWISRMYRSSMHNYVINKHRETALRTFEAFVKAGKDDMETKTFILRQTTQSIFSHQQSGYISSEADPTPSSAQVIEVVKQMHQATK